MTLRSGRSWVHEITARVTVTSLPISVSLQADNKVSERLLMSEKNHKCKLSRCA